MAPVSESYHGGNSTWSAHCLADLVKINLTYKIDFSICLKNYSFCTISLSYTYNAYFLLQGDGYLPN
jgi:hypothetical protein